MSISFFKMTDFFCTYTGRAQKQRQIVFLLRKLMRKVFNNMLYWIEMLKGTTLMNLVAKRMNKI